MSAPPDPPTAERSPPEAGWSARLNAGLSSEVLYVVCAAACTLGALLWFHTSMRHQVAMLHASSVAAPLGAELRALGSWSAPLDDVFIHFDFARSTARGYPFQWSEGNGYSTGGTSLLYPWILAIGYYAGFRELSLVVWATLVAAVGTLAFLLAARRAFRALPPAAALVAPPLVLAVGALDWTLFSGMEVALFLALWGAAFVVWDELWETLESGRSGTALALTLGSVGALTVATRPEALVTVALFGVSAAGRSLWRPAARLGSGSSRGSLGRLGGGLLILTASCAPTAALVFAQALVNRALTGDATAAGAISKLELHDPFRDLAQIAADWRFFFTYQIDRLTDYHLADDARHGWVVWVLALFALVPSATRRPALMLWTSALGWAALVALNGQVRWQNERYAMPALAWVLLAAALGVAALLSLPRGRSPHVWWLRSATALGAAVSLLVFAQHQRPRFREQVWFFGRASRNILEQHVRVGLLLRHALDPAPRRVAVGDAGAIPYIADVPALDLIGLGGYHQLPFARAKRLGLGAVIELVERMPEGERPDVFALFPSWWDTLPDWFGRTIVEVPVRGNVICGGSTKVVYRAHFASLRDSPLPVGMAPVRVVDELDVGDLVSEGAHHYKLDRRHSGRVDMKLFAHPEHPQQDLWDAGRVVPAGGMESFRLRGLRADYSPRLVLRVAPPGELVLRVGLDDHWQELVVRGGEGWQHVVLEVPPAVVTSDLHVRITAPRVEWTSFHVWAVEAP